MLGRIEDETNESDWNMDGFCLETEETSIGQKMESKVTDRKILLSVFELRNPRLDRGWHRSIIHVLHGMAVMQ